MENTPHNEDFTWPQSKGILLKHALQLESLEQRVKHMETLVFQLTDMRNTITRLEERLKAQEARLDEQMRHLEAKMDQWRSLIWAIMLILLTQIAVAAFEYLKKGG